MVPGLAHGGGNFPPTWVNLNVPDNWVESGVAPRPCQSRMESQSWMEYPSVQGRCVFGRPGRNT